MTLSELARWHRKQAKASTGALADFHRAAVSCLMDIISRKKAHRSAIHEGLARARKAGKVLGRARIDPAIENAIRRSLLKGDKGMHRIAAEHGVGTGTVQRVKAKLAAK
jgi:DNA invertase Pin-like site-specific DNA recombinase